MNQKARRWCLRYSAVLMILTSIPYWLGFTGLSDDWRFTGFVFAVEDGNSYIAKMNLGSMGDWLFRTPYTSDPQRGVIAFLPYLLLGKLASGEALHEQLVVLFHLFRVLATPFAVMASYAFLSLFIEEERWRRWGTLLATVGGGLGWIVLPLAGSDWLGSLPLEFYSPETFGFLAFFGIPHLILARALLLLGLVWYIRAFEVPNLAWQGGVALLALALVQPLTVLVGYAVIGGHQIALLGWASSHRTWGAWLAGVKIALRTVIVPLPVVAYLWIAFSSEPFLRGWTAQNVIRSPHPLHYLAAYGLFLIPALYGARRLLAAGGSKSLLPVSWAVLLPALAYAPHNLQRRFPEGIWVAFVTLALLGLAAWAVGSETKTRLAVLFLVLTLPSSVLLLVGGVRVATFKGEPAFRRAEEVAAFAWLGALDAKGDVVLASFDTGNALPAWAPMQVVIGHGPESVGLAELEPQVAAFFGGGMTDLERESFLRARGVDFVFFGPHEAELGDWEPSAVGFLRLRYERGEYRIYEFTKR